MKYDYKKDERDIYGVKKIPMVVNIPNQKFICIDGIGNPNSEDFAENIGVLYQMSYTIKMMPRNGYTPEHYFEYTIYPLEGLWSLTDKGIEIQKSRGELDKNEFKYTLMIKQPAFVNEEVFNRALEIAKKKKANILLDNVYYREIVEGLSCQILHNGSYDSEPESFEIMKKHLEENGYERMGFIHKEIYLSDARRTAADKLKTILRIKIKK